MVCLVQHNCGGDTSPKHFGCETLSWFNFVRSATWQRENTDTFLFLRTVTLDAFLPFLVIATEKKENEQS